MLHTSTRPQKFGSSRSFRPCCISSSLRSTSKSPVSRHLQGRFTTCTANGKMRTHGLSVESAETNNVGLDAGKLPVCEKGKGYGFYRGDDGYLYCENLKVDDVHAQVPGSPFFLYSKEVITDSFNAYKDALQGMDHVIGFAVKCNNNLVILKHLQQLGSGAVLVSGNEIRLALEAGFDPSKLIFNGNGKQPEELELAVRENVLVNINSEVDLENISAAARKVGKPVRVLLRINPDVDQEVEPYMSTGETTSKYGIQNGHLDSLLDTISKDTLLEIVGVHCHLGSAITDISVYEKAATSVHGLIAKIRDTGFNLQFLNMDGGLGVDYHRSGVALPTPTDLVGCIKPTVEEFGLTLIMEPGRSMIATSAALINRVTGCKTNGSKDFIVVDGSMSTLIRVSLYDAYMAIELTAPCNGEVKEFDIVGPVCESADFLGKGRRLPTPQKGAGLAVLDSGADSMCMASAYNLKMPPPEYWVEDGHLRCIRKAQTLDNYFETFEGL